MDVIQKKIFKEEGYITLNEDFFSNSELEELRQEVKKTLPSWESGSVDPKTINAREDFRFSEQFNIGNIKFKGIARSHRYTRGKGAIKNEDNTNWLYGKRATLLAQYWPEKIVSLIENKSIIKVAKFFLDTDELSFHNGSISAVYPGCTGEEMSIHADTVGFSESNEKAFTHYEKQNFLLNIMIYLDDVDEDLAPTRIFPKTHSKYKEINTHFANCFNGSTKKNYYFNSGSLYDELLPPNLESPIFFLGKRGSVNLMNSSVLHSSTENKTKNNTRYAVILNFSRKRDKHFSKNYSISPNDLALFRSRIKNKRLIEKTFDDKKKKLSFKDFFLNALKSRLSKFVLRYPTGEIISPINILKSFIPSKTKEPSKKDYLNLGAGPRWRHNNILSLDFDSPSFPGKSEISHNLNIKKPLPFANERFKGIYTSHNLEHLQESQVLFILSELHRCLKSEGILRITVPDMMAHFDAYERRDILWFDWIRNKGFYKFDSWLRLLVRSFAGSIVDNYSNDELHDLYKKLPRKDFLDFFTKKVDLIKNEEFLSPDIHKSWWSNEKMIEALLNIGFSSAKKVSQFESHESIFVDKTFRSDNKYFNMTRPEKSIFIEGIK